MERLYHLLLISCATVLCILAGCAADARSKLNVGDKAPDFILIDEEGNAHKLSSMRGTKVALLFYPLDQSRYCTQQVCSIRDGFADLEAAGIAVWGINQQSVESHKKFKEKHDLPFSLLSDPKKRVAKTYGAKRPLGFPNRRITVLIDGDGIIVAILDDINVAKHAQEIIRAFKQ